jgi:hypothetical protein
MATIHAPAPAPHTAAHPHLRDLWHALVAAGQPHGAHLTPAPHLMTDPDVFDVFGEDDAA